MFTRTTISVLIGAFALYQLQKYFILVEDNAGLRQIKFDDPPAEKTLKRALVIFRHGDRAPNEYSSRGRDDPHSCRNKALWPNGCGELTKKGKQDAFHLGQRLRHRYSAILTDGFSKSNLKVTSTLMSRTLMSASLVSAGLYFPPKGTHSWHDSIPWHPVPVFPNSACNMSNSFLCPSFAIEVSKMISKAEQELKANSELIATLREGGIDVDSPKSSVFFMLLLIFDEIFLAERNGLPLQPWQRKILTQYESEVAKMFSYFIVGNDKLGIISAGPQMKWIVNELTAEPSRNFTMYSGHDLTLVAVMWALGIDPLIYLYPTSCLALEYHEVNGKQLVKVFFYEEAKGKFKKMKIACEDSSNEGCNYEQFLNLIGKSYPDNYYDICQGNKDDPMKINENVKMFVRSVRAQFTQ